MGRRGTLMWKMEMSDTILNMKNILSCFNLYDIILVD